MIFVDRRAAGRQLAERLVSEPLVRDADRLVVMAIPRGGLPVAVEVARALDGTLDVAVASELRLPYDPDVAFGAVGSDDYTAIDDDAVARLGLGDDEVAAEVERRRAAVARRVSLYRRAIPPADVDGAVALVVDDGIASGGTARQACRLARRRGAAHVVLAVPVAPADVAQRLDGEADRIVVLTSPPEFLSVGQAYQDFPRFEDEELLALVREPAPSEASSQAD